MVRSAEPRDEQALLRLRAALWPEEKPEECLLEVRLLVTGITPVLLPYKVLIAEMEEAVVGFVEVALRSYVDGCETGRPVGFVEGWYVAPEFRRRGVGRSLIEAAEAWCREQGCHEIGSDTWIDNEVSQQAHGAVGFEEVERSITYRKSIEPEDADSVHYGTDLAAIHDAHFGQVARDAAAELLNQLSSAGISRGLVVDLAAGSGILSRRLIAAGFEAHGVDISSAMVRLARRKVPEATFVEGSLWEADLPDKAGEAVAIAAVGEAFCYATDGTAGLAGLGRRLADLYRALAPGGLLIFDVAGPGRSGGTGKRERCFSFDRTTLHFEEREDPDSGTLLRDITLFLPFGRLYRRSDENHRLVLYEPESVEELLAETGFSWRRLDGYDQARFPVGWYGFIARKPDDATESTS